MVQAIVAAVAVIALTVTFLSTGEPDWVARVKLAEVANVPPALADKAA